MIPVAEARARILAPLLALPAQTLPLSKAAGRVLAEDIRAKRTQPEGAVSAMDGYAVRAGDLAAPPVRLTLTGAIPAGAAPTRGVGAGEAMRIFTGALVPEGADTVIAQEDTQAGDGSVEIQIEASAGRHIRPAGRDFHQDTVVLAAGTRLAPRHLALAAAAGWADLPVHRRPRVGVLATGDELVRAGTATGIGQTVASSLDGLLAQVEGWGGVGVDLGIARDTEDALRQALQAAGEVDYLVTLGGASVGEHDLVRQVIAGQGSVDFWRIAMRPGKPLMAGHWTGRPFLGLPGNPVSSLVCALLFLRPALERLQGLAGDAPTTVPVRLAGALPANGPREDYMRAHLERGSDGVATAEPFETQDSSMLSLFAAANALLIRPPHAREASAGDPAEAIPLTNLFV